LSLCVQFHKRGFFVQVHILFLHMKGQHVKNLTPRFLLLFLHFYYFSIFYIDSILWKGGYLVLLTQTIYIFYFLFASTFLTFYYITAFGTPLNQITDIRGGIQEIDVRRKWTIINPMFRDLASEASVCEVKYQLSGWLITLLENFIKLVVLGFHID
jgi:hypothetical protein